MLGIRRTLVEKHCEVKASNTMSQTSYSSHEYPAAEDSAVFASPLSCIPTQTITTLPYSWKKVNGRMGVAAAPRILYQARSREHRGPPWLAVVQYRT
jgi:hypothetical protein